MEPVPLIPESNLPTNPDTSHILQDEFQKYLSRKLFPPKIAGNLAKFKSEYVELKQCGQEVDDSFKQLQHHSDKIGYAEKEIITSQVNYLTTTPKFDPSPLEIRTIYPEIDKKIVEKYNLLQAKDLLPHITERILDPKYPISREGFTIPCTQTWTKTVEPHSITKIIQNPPAFRRIITKDNYFDKVKDNVVPDCTDGLIVRETIEVHRINSFPYVKKLDDWYGRRIIDTDPNWVEFCNIKANVTYQKLVTIRNIITKPLHFKYGVHSGQGYFTAACITKSFRISPGLAAQILIKFKPGPIKDYSDKLVIYLEHSDDVYLELRALAPRPIIKGLICNPNEKIDELQLIKLKNNILNENIDCGGCLLGRTKELKFVLKNFGDYGKFFVLNEDSWVFNELTALNETTKLKLDEFLISPAFFELNRDDMTRMRIQFCPLNLGLCSDKIIILCDNNSVKEIEIMGDCIQMSKDMFTFKIPKRFCVCQRPFDTPQYTINLGRMSYNQETIVDFVIINKSKVPLEFQWKFSQEFTNEKCYPIPAEWIQIEPIDGTLEPCIPANFEIRFKMGIREIGDYICNYDFCVMSIPGKSLEELEGYDVKPAIEPQCFNVNYEILGVVAKNIMYPVEISREEITFKKLKFNTASKFKEATVKNNSKFPIKFDWLYPETILEISPQNFEIPSKSEQTCKFNIVPIKSYEDLDEIITLSINDHSFEKYLRIIGTFKQPKIRVSDRFFNCGIVKRNADIQVNFKILNNSQLRLKWEAREYRYNFDTDRFVEMEYMRDIDEEFMTGKKECFEISYKVDTQEPHHFFCLIIFYTDYNSIRTQNDYVLIIADIQKPEISILNEENSPNIFCPDEKFFLSETITRKFYLNNKSFFDIDYKWEEPIGFDKDAIRVKFDEDSGTVDTSKRRPVEITLEFLEPGNILDFFIPLNVEGLDEYVLLQVVCKIRELYVVFLVPGFQKFRWPDVWSDDSRLRDYIYELTDNGEEDLGQSQYEMHDLQPVPEDILHYLKTIEIHSEEDIPDIVSYASSTDLSDHSMFNLFDQEIAESDIVVEISHLQCKTVHKKIIEISNCMNINLPYTVEVTNFKAKCVKLKKIDQILAEMKLKDDISYSERLSEFGVVVIATPENGVLEQQSTIEVELEVYAETWGVYLEEIVFTFENLPPFTLKLFIHVVGYPIEYPMMLSCPTKTNPYMKFCCKSFCTAPESRTLTLYNSSTIPINIHWHIFTKFVSEPPVQKPPLSIIFDLFEFEHKECDRYMPKVNIQTEANLRLIKYIGKEEDKRKNYFTIEPYEIVVKAKEYTSVAVTIHPDYFKDKTKNLNLRAVLIGNLFIEEKYRIHSNFLLRFPQKYLKPTKVALKARIENPCLDLRHVQGKPSLSISINDILNCYIEEDTIFHLLFKNKSCGSVLIGMQTEQPFEVMSMMSATSHSMRNRDCTVQIDGDDCVEVKLKCKISEKLIATLADYLYNSKTIDLDGVIIDSNQIFISRNLNIYQKCEIQYILPLNLNLVFPQLQISANSLEFGQVRVGTFKEMAVKVLNKTASNTWIKLSLALGNDFKINYDQGYLDPCTVHDRSLFVTVTFTPKDILNYEDVLVINTLLPEYVIKIPLLGLGTFDDKYFCKKVSYCTK